MKTPWQHLRGGGTSWHKSLVTGAVAVMLAASCEGGILFDDDDGSSSGIACCEAACVSQIGTFSFRSEGAPVTIDGHVTVTELSTGTVLVDSDVQGDSIFAQPNEQALAQFEDQNITANVVVEAIGFSRFEGTFPLSVFRDTICCSSCVSASGGGVIELGPGATLNNGCDPGGGTGESCPSTPPLEFGDCSGEFSCCNYDTQAGTLGCTCMTDGWHCGASACTCN